MMNKHLQPCGHNWDSSRLEPLAVMVLVALVTALLPALMTAHIIFLKHIVNQWMAASAGLLFVVGALWLRQRTANNSQPNGSRRN